MTIDTIFTADREICKNYNYNEISTVCLDLKFRLNQLNILICLSDKLFLYTLLIRCNIWTINLLMI